MPLLLLPPSSELNGNCFLDRINRINRMNYNGSSCHPAVVEPFLPSILSFAVAFVVLGERREARAFGAFPE